MQFNKNSEKKITHKLVFFKRDSAVATGYNFYFKNNGRAYRSGELYWTPFLMFELLLLFGKIGQNVRTNRIVAVEKRKGSRIVLYNDGKNDSNDDNDDNILQQMPRVKVQSKRIQETDDVVILFIHAFFFFRSGAQTTLATPDNNHDWTPNNLRRTSWFVRAQKNVRPMQPASLTHTHQEMH